MNFTPKTEKELSEENLFPAGVYPFEVLEAKDTTSKKGNEMIELKLRVFHGERHQFVNDYLLESIGYKLRHSAVTLGLGDAYESGSLSGHDYKGKSGFVKLKITKDKTGTYPDKNEVADYVEEPKAGGGPLAPKAGTGGNDPADDDIPFAANVL